MGNGPGGLVEYIALFRSHPLSQGGLVWEWNNHGLLKQEGDLEYYAYGGDFGDEPNDADFVMDGLTLSDHTPMPSLLEYAKIIQPVSVSLTDDSSQMVVTNHYGFVDLSGLNALWFVVQDGEVTEPQELDIPRVPAGENRTVDLPLDTGNLTQEAWLTIEFQLPEDKAWADAGHVVAWDQLYLPSSSSSSSPSKRSTAIKPRQESSAFQIDQSRTNLTVQTSQTTFGFDLLQGNVTWTVNGIDIFTRGPELYFYRAMTQNDEASAGNMAEWDEARVGMMHTQVRDVSWSSDDESNSVTVHFKVRVAPLVLEWGVEADLVYTISSAGEDSEPSLHVQASGDFVGRNTPSVIPRIGLRAVLPASFNQVSWFGRGPGENYKDSKQACRIGEYEATVEELYTPYEYPQENGNHEDLRWVQISNSGSDSGSDSESRSESVTLDARRSEAGSTFSFTASQYMPFDLNDAKHPFDLEPLDMTVLYLDYDNHGLGSATVGPLPFEQYRCYTDAFEFGFELSLV